MKNILSLQASSFVYTIFFLVSLLFFFSYFSASAQAQPQKLGVFGHDNRTDYLDIDLHTIPLRFVGLLTTKRADGRTSTCSSFLISPQVVLTASHCVTNIEGEIDPKDPKAPQISFWLRYNGKPITDNFKFKGIRVLHGTALPDVSGGRNPHLSRDYAAIVLDRHTQEQGANLQTYQSTGLERGGRRLHIAGYPGTHAGVLYFDTIREYTLYKNDRLLTHHGALSPGQSGGPIIIGQRVIGVHSFITKSFNASITFDNNALQEIRGWTRQYDPRSY